MAPLLQVDNISVSFDGFKAINKLSFEIGETELRAIIGPNGAGKTTFMDIVTGLTRPDSGDVRWLGTNISLLKQSESQIAQLGIGRKFQKPTTFEAQTVYENLLMSLANNRNPFAVLAYRRSPRDEDRIDGIARQINLAESLDQFAGELSHGQKQWLEIGMLLSQNPKLMLIDEPAAGMTPTERNQTVSILKNIAKSSSIIVVEHDMEFVRNLNCRVTVLNEGSILSSGSIDFITQNEKVIEVYLGR